MSGFDQKWENLVENVSSALQSNYTNIPKRKHSDVTTDSFYWAGYEFPLEKIEYEDVINSGAPVFSIGDAKFAADFGIPLYKAFMKFAYLFDPFDKPFVYDRMDFSYFNGWTAEQKEAYEDWTSLTSKTTSNEWDLQNNPKAYGGQYLPRDKDFLYSARLVSCINSFAWHTLLDDNVAYYKGGRKKYDMANYNNVEHFVISLRNWIYDNWEGIRDGSLSVL